MTVVQKRRIMFHRETNFSGATSCAGYSNLQLNNRKEDSLEELFENPFEAA